MKKLFISFLLSFHFNPGTTNAQGIYQLWGTTSKGGISNQGVLFSTDQYGNKYNVRKNFTSDYTGAKPWASKLVEYGGKLYGVSVEGGTWNLGVVFRYDPNFGTYELIHSFNGADGSKPYRGLTIFGTKIYGLTSLGGASNVGVLYEIDPVTKSFTLKLNLNNASTGGTSFAAMIEYNGKLYGSLRSGGANGYGTIFSYQPATNTFTNLFDKTDQIGRGVLADFCLYNNKLYGVAPSGGTSNNGAIFVFDPADNSCINLYSFLSVSNAFGGMVVLNNKLYGISGGWLSEFDPSTNAYIQKSNTGYIGEIMVFNNNLWGFGPPGSNDNGSVFEYDPATNIYIKRVTMPVSGILGRSPSGTLILFNSKLYGMTNLGGIMDMGALLQFDPIGYGLIKKCDFNDNSKEGEQPNAGVVLLGSKFYGMTTLGGEKNVGTIFTYDLLNNSFFKVDSFVTGSNLGSYWPYGRITFTNSKFYGLTYSSPYGSIFEFDTLTMNKTVLFNFSSAINGQTPQGTFTLYNNKLYGFTNQGGVSPISFGTVFDFDPLTNTHTRRSDMICSSGGCQPTFGNGFTEFNGKLYALTTDGGGSGSIGTISEYDPASGQFIMKLPLGNLGSFPRGAFTKVNDKLYGNVTNGILEYDPVSNIAIKKYTHTAATGNFAWSDLTLIGNRLYGTARDGGTNDLGTFYEYNLSTNTFTKKLDFNGTNGAKPTYMRMALVPAPVSIGTPGSCFSVSPITINNNNEWVAFTDDKGEAIAEINANGNNLGQVNLSLYVHNGVIRSDGSNNKFLNRNIRITSTNAPSTGVGIRLYIRQSEADGLIAIPGSGVAETNDIRLFRNSITCQSAIPNLVDSISSTINNWMGGFVYETNVSSFSSYYFTSKNYTIPICPTNTWTGAVSSAWENPSNWSCGSLPNNNSFVIINTSAAHYPEVNSNAICRSLTVQPGAIISIRPGYIINITGQ